MMRRPARIFLSIFAVLSVLVATPLVGPPQAQATTSTTATVAIVSPSLTQVVAARGSQGSVVYTIQRNLATLGLFPSGYITGYFGSITESSVRRFQQTRGLAVTGVVTQALFDRIASEARARLAATVVARYGSQGSTVYTIQRNLATLGYFPWAYTTGYFGSITRGAVIRYQAAHQLAQTGVVTRALYDRLAQEAARVAASRVLDRRCLTGARVLCVSKTTLKLYYVTNGRIIKTMDARFGAWNTPTREGQFQVYWKSEYHWSTLYNSSMPFSMFFFGGQAIHYSSDFAARGYAGASHGCINIRDYNGLHWVFHQVQIGDKVVVYR